MSDLEKNLENALARFGDLSKKGLGIAKETIVQSSHTVKGKLAIMELKREKKRFLENLGAELIDAISSGKIDTALFNETISNISDIDLKIEKKESELEGLSEEDLHQEQPQQKESSGEE